MESNAGDLTVEELKDWHKQDKSKGDRSLQLCACMCALSITWHRQDKLTCSHLSLQEPMLVCS